MFDETDSPLSFGKDSSTDQDIFSESTGMIRVILDDPPTDPSVSASIETLMETLAEKTDTFGKVRSGITDDNQDAGGFVPGLVTEGDGAVKTNGIAKPEE